MRVRHRALLCLGLLIALLVAPPASAKKGKKQFTVAVMAFQNASGDKEHESLGLGFQSMMTTDLAQVEAFELVERARLNDVLEEHKLAKSRLTDKKKVVKLGKLVGATHLLGGSFIIQGDKMRVDARLVSAQTGRVVLAEKVEGLKDAFFELEKKLVDQVIRALGAKLSAKERAKVARVHTVEFKAFKAFSQGVRHFDNKRYESALKALL
jgi:TolB-like protein